MYYGFWWCATRQHYMYAGRVRNEAEMMELCIYHGSSMYQMLNIKTGNYVKGFV